MHEKKYAAVIAAAGLSSRMHEFKPMLCMENGTIIENVIRNFQSAGVDEIVVVTGYKSETLRRHLKSLQVHICENTAYAETKMFDSLLMGLNALQAPYDYVFLTPGDVPLVKRETICQMQLAAAPIVIPVYNGRPGHPVMLAADSVRKIKDYTGRDGLKGAVHSVDVPILNIQVYDKGVLLDADTPEDLRRLRRQEMENRSAGRLCPDIRIHIAKGDTILTPGTAQFLEMIGHTGSIQSACSCMHMSYFKGWKLLNHMEQELGYLLVERYPGGVNGGGSALSTKGNRLLAAYQQYQTQVKALAENLFGSIFEQDLHGRKTERAL